MNKLILSQQETDLSLMANSFTTTGARFDVLPSVTDLVGYAAAGMAIEQAAMWYMVDLLTIMIDGHNMSIDDVMDALPESFPWRSKGTILNRTHLGRVYPAFQKGKRYLSAAEAIGVADVEPVTVEILGNRVPLRCIEYQAANGPRIVPLTAYADAASLKTLPKRVQALAWFVANDATVQAFRDMLRGVEHQDSPNGQVMEWATLMGHLETVRENIARIPAEVRPSVDALVDVAQGKIRVIR